MFPRTAQTALAHNINTTALAPLSPGSRAAMYVRMSTEHQKYSTANQAAAIERYAQARGFKVVQTYTDRGRSGLTLSGRLALQTLLSDIESGRADFDAVLVYDVSRWGRFPDPDEAAAVELRCRRAGIAVHYCAEQFENDGSPGSSIIKSVKRVMAGEYSRELSVKVFAGQSRIAGLGFWPGGTAGYGLRRVLIDPLGSPRQTLDRGQHKNLATDRVTLIPGPDDEVAIVREIYQQFTAGGLHEGQIVDSLNARAVPTGLGADRPWTRQIVRKILVSEKYVGNIVWARTSCKLQQQRIVNSESDWVRANAAFEPLVPVDVFCKAQAKMRARRRHISDQVLLDHLRGLLKKEGYLSASLLDRSHGPSAERYRKRFGSIRRAYAMIGHNPKNDFRFIDINLNLHGMRVRFEDEIIGGIAAAGGHVERDQRTGLLKVNDEFTVRFEIARAFRTRGTKSLRWRIVLDSPFNPDFLVLARMNAENDTPRDFYVFPRLGLGYSIIHLGEQNPQSLDAYRCETLQPFFQVAGRKLVEEAIP